MKKSAYLYAVVCIICLSTSCKKDPDLQTPPEVEVSGLRVDLRPQQTAIRNQGNRGTCITFAAVAALEAAYKRIGYGDLDLSEEFLGYMGKNFWLHHKKGYMLWDQVAAKGPGAAENQLGFSGGGQGSGVVLMMDKLGVKAPLEEEMPYVSVPVPYGSNPNWFPPIGTPPNQTKDPRYKLQYYVDNFNLDTNNLSHQLLHSENYYGVESARYYFNAADATNTNLIESILKRKYEVVWDWAGKWFFEDDDGDRYGVWRPCKSTDTGCRTDAHCMLIVGFDRTDPDPKNHYFMVKNSWGRLRIGDDQGFTRISYDFVQQFGFMMAYIGLPILEAGPWEDIKKIGRYKLVYDGHEGLLDIFHIPGYWPVEELGVPDRRLGIMFDGEMKPHRVNGFFDDNRVILYFSDVHPNLRWDQMGQVRSDGRRFTYYYSDKGYMAGYHVDSDGEKYGGYARKMGALPVGTLTPRPFLPKSYINSKWDVMIDQREGAITLGQIEDYEPEFPDFYYIKGTYTDNHSSGTGKVLVKIPQGQFNHPFIQVDVGKKNLAMEGWHLNHTAGNIAGHTIGGGSGEKNYPFIMVRK